MISDWAADGFEPTLLNVAVAPGQGNQNYHVRKESVGSVDSVWDGTEQDCATFQLNVGP